MVLPVDSALYRLSHNKENFYLEIAREK